MKASKKPTRREVERVANEVSEDMIRCLQSETAVGIIATARFFGLGKKRAKAYLDYLEKVKAEFAQRYIYSGKFRNEAWEEYCERTRIKERVG